MSLSVRVPLGPTPGLIRLETFAVPVLAGFGVLASLALQAGQSPAWGLSALPLALICLGLRRRFMPQDDAGPRGWLLIDDDGRVFWQPTGADAGASAESTQARRSPASAAGDEGLSACCPFEPTSWDIGQLQVSLRGRLSTVQPAPALAHRPILDLRLSRASLSAEQWRGLRVWLLWRQRGGQPGRPL